MATHSSILAWRIPWTEEICGLQSMGGKESDTTERLHFHFHSHSPKGASWFLKWGEGRGGSVGARRGLSGLPTPLWCYVQASCMAPCFCSRNLRSGSWVLAFLYFFVHSLRHLLTHAVIFSLL